MSWEMLVTCKKKYIQAACTTFKDIVFHGGCIYVHRRSPGLSWSMFYQHGVQHSAERFRTLGERSAQEAS